MARQYTHIVSVHLLKTAIAVYVAVLMEETIHHPTCIPRSRYSKNSTLPFCCGHSHIALHHDLSSTSSEGEHPSLVHVSRYQGRLRVVACPNSLLTWNTILVKCFLASSQLPVSGFRMLVLRKLVVRSRLLNLVYGGCIVRASWSRGRLLGGGECVGLEVVVLVWGGWLLGSRIYIPSKRKCGLVIRRFSTVRG